MRTLIASFGFDIDFVLRRLASGKYSRVVLVSLKTRDGFERVKKAYSTLSLVCTSLKVDCTLEPVTPNMIPRSVQSLLLNEAEKSDELEVYLTGGPRILVTALLLSVLMLSKDHAQKTQVFIEGEGFDCTMKINVNNLIERLSLDERDKIIINTLEGEKLTLGEIARKTGMPKSTVHRRLEDLIEKGLIARTEIEVYTANPLAEITCVE
ncbi:MAG: helix-turn-helix domain-containing protein [Desulfurococcaceae archaeon]|jgi:CRISPR-associated protein Csa3|nr:helix-turn-helix domain-containing protein [Desulfurococcaceae archaeon]